MGSVLLEDHFFHAATTRLGDERDTNEWSLDIFQPTLNPLIWERAMDTARSERTLSAGCLETHQNLSKSTKPSEVEYLLELDAKALFLCTSRCCSVVIIHFIPWYCDDAERRAPHNFRNTFYTYLKRYSHLRNIANIGSDTCNVVTFTNYLRLALPNQNATSAACMPLVSPYSARACMHKPETTLHADSRSLRSARLRTLISPVFPG
jgi:hypothetical protein